jgi:acetyl/propionyl-CoA carboxylase alpha subunit
MRPRLVEVDGIVHRVERKPDGVFELDGNGTSARVEGLPGRRYRVVTGDQAYVFCAELQEDGSYLFLHEGFVYKAVLVRSAIGGTGSEIPPAGSGRREVLAPLPALVTNVKVAVGDTVEPGTGLLVLEAMKMENEIKAGMKGRVKEIRVRRGSAVERGQLLIVVEA